MLPKNLLYILLSLLVGLYSGINLSGIHHHGHHGHGGLPDNNEVLTIAEMNERIKKMESQVDLWKSKADVLEKEYAAAVNKVHTLEHDGCQAAEEDEPEEEHDQRPLENPNPHPMCQSLPFPTPSAMALWNQNILSVLRSTQLPNDNRYKFHDFTTQILQIVSPRLHRSVKSMPHDMRSLERAMSVVWKRYEYLELSKEDRKKVSTPPPRPLKILVMGGSLLVGTNCRKLLQELGLSFRLPKRDCTWSNRLEEFLNAFANHDVVEVTKVAMGGTNTATGNVIWQYDLIPEEARNPDIVLNAYSTNDMHILTILEAQSSNVTLRDKVFEMTQDYVRNVLHTCDPDRPPPLLLHVDDYLGNEQRKIWDTTELSQGVQVLANYYGFTSFSYADVVREIVYGDTHEAWLSANWWETGTFEREIHPNMGMHIASTWVIAYNLLNLVTTYCSIPPTPRDYNIQEYKPGYLGLPTLRNDVVQAKNKPQPHPKGLPPVLTKDLLIEDVSRLWKENEEKMAPCDPDKQLQDNHYDHLHAKCPFSWVSGLSLQQNNETWIQEYFRNQATVWDGWNLGNDGGKLGFTPTGAHSSATNNSTDMVLDFAFEQTIRSITIFFMKSYGEKWKGSQLKFRAWKVLPSVSDTSPLAQILLQEKLLPGIHDKETSEMYTEAMELPEPIPIGTKLRVEALLAGGTMFKIMGLAICS